MSKYRNQLPQLTNERFISDGGLETTLIFHHGYELPETAAFDLMSQPKGYEVIHDYFTPYLELARQNQVNFILESPTWRASRDWGEKLGYTNGDLQEVNSKSIAMLEDIRRSYECTRTKVVISGCMGPRRDGYRVDSRMTPLEAESYHLPQIDTFSRTAADLVTGFTLNYSDEAIGIVRAARRKQIPVAVGFTVETDGRLPSGEDLAAVIEKVDRETADYPAYYMVNCAHPTHFADQLNQGGTWTERIRAIRPNASDKSHTELDESEVLDAGDPEDLGRRCRDLARRMPHLNIFGGCCGTDLRHLEQICYAAVGQA